jgi:hypothetical protein
MTKFYIYLITNNILNKQYVGSRICYKNINEDNNYMGTSKYLDEDYKIYNINNFTKEILKDDYQNKIDMLNGETNFILKYNTLAPNGYNRFLPNTRNGFHMGGCKMSEETKLKISFSSKGKSRNKGNKVNKKGKKVSEETKLKMSKSHLGKTRAPMSEETKIKISMSLTGISKNKGNKPSQETKNKMSKSHIGILHSEEAKEKMKILAVGRNLGRKLSKEHKKKISESRNKKGQISLAPSFATLN